MKLRAPLAAAGAAIVLGATGGFLLPAVANAHSAAVGSAPGATHTLKFIVVTNKFVRFTKATYLAQETDVSGTGKTVGFDEGSITFKTRNVATAGVTFVRLGGFLYGRFTTTNGGKTLTGKITGGTGAFNNATGTITGKAITSTKTAVTITYSSSSPTATPTPTSTPG